MGSSSWYHFIAYQPDVNQALVEIRHRVFLESKQRRLQRLQQMSQPERDRLFYLTQGDREVRGVPLYADIDAWLSDEAQQSIEDWEFDPDRGFHTVLDIDHIAQVPEFRGTTFVSEQIVQKVFGTIYPTHEMVLHKIHDLDVLCPKWSGSYCIAYEGQEPKEYCFYGITGD